MEVSFEELVDWGKAKGLELHPSLERRCKDRVWGMYATAPIEAGDVLSRCPKSALLSADPSIYPSGTSPSVMNIHTAAKVFEELGAQSCSHFSLFESLEDLQAHSVFYLSSSDLNRLKEASTNLYQNIVRHNEKNRMIIEALSKFDSSLSQETLTLMVLNYGSRAFGKLGFLPLVECFNHSISKGAMIDVSQDYISLYAKESLQENDQAFISYGNLDIYTHAISYDYYDPSDTHVLELGKRIRFPILKASDLSFVQQLPWTVTHEVLGGIRYFSVGDINALCYEEGPSPQAIEIMRKIAERYPPEKHSKNACGGTQKLLESLESCLEQNNVDGFSAKYFPKAARRFYHVLKKEKQLIEANIERLHH